MRLTIAAIGRLKAGPERDLADRYADRVTKAGKALGLTLVVREFAESRAATADLRKEQEAGLILGAVPSGAALVALDEKGKSLDSRSFAALIENRRDGGTADLVFAIGGADGLGEAVLGKAAARIAFGALTWPHQLVRIMLAEQLYRAVTILSGHPYHRD
jgi:23S rRNA (pseudouridine1915-N3)-methyltransferase